MNKKILQILIAAALLFVATFTVSGCINSEAEKYKADTGITMMLSYDGENYRADFIILTDKANYDSAADDYMLSVLKTEFDAEKVEVSETETGNAIVVFIDAESGEVRRFSNNGYTMFAYSAVIKEDQWFLNGDPAVDYGFINIDVSCDYENPFALVYKENTPLNRIYNILKNGGRGLDKASNYFWGLDNSSDFDNINTKVLLPARSSVKAGNGTIIYDPESHTHLYQVSGRLGDVANNRLIYSYTAMASYGWFTIAIILGLIAVALVLLLAKKKDGRAVDLTVKPDIFVNNSQPQSVFGGFNGPFGGAGGAGGSGSSGAGGSGGSAGGGTEGSGTGGVFDGF